MPEMPEVETIVRVLRGWLVGETVSDVQVRWARSIAIPAASEFVDTLVGHTATDVARRGKFIIISLPPKFLLVHLRMTGRLLACDQPDDSIVWDKHVHVVIHFASGRALCFRDVRKFGRLYLVDHAEDIVGDLGPEPLSDEFTSCSLRALLQGRRRQIKPMLLDQRVLAGLGNIYVDESLWEAGIHPLRQAHTLTDDEIMHLHTRMRNVLNQAIINRGTTLRDYRDPQNEAGENQWVLAVYARQGRPCKRCGHIIERSRVGGRGTHYCPVCQPLDGKAGRGKDE